MAHGVADEGEALEHDERAHHRADDADEEGRDEPALHERRRLSGSARKLDEAHQPAVVVEVALACPRPRRGGGRRRGRGRRPPRSGRTRTWPPYVSARSRWSRTRSLAGPVAMIRRLTSAASWKRCAAQARSWVVATTVLPALRLRLEDVHQVLLGGRVHAGDRLVEQVERRVPRRVARARKTRRRWPPDRAPIWRSTCVAPCRPSRARRRRASRSARPGPRPEADPRRTRPIITTSPTVTGNSQSTASACGT